MSMYRQTCEKFAKMVKEIGGYYCVRDGVVEVNVHGVPEPEFGRLVFKAQVCLYALGGGHVWGSDGVGYDAQMRRGHVWVCKSPTRKSILNCLAEMQVNQ